MRLSDLNLNLGIPRLLPAWKNLFSADHFMSDLIAGITVAFIAIPLSLAIALASGVSPGVGLITAIVAGIVCALFGGTPLAVSGPAAAMTIVIADIVEKFGLTSLIFIGGLAGLMQLTSGVLGLGRFGKFVPLPVIAGFTAGIGVIILIGQLPRAFGLMPPPESDIFSVFLHLKQYLHAINGSCIFLVALTIGIIHGLPKVLPRVPAILPAVIISSIVAYFADFGNVPLIGSIPDTLPFPQFPAFPAISIQDLVINALIIYLLASLETLLSSSAVDKLSQGSKHDANQELIGQGLGNIAVSLFGGIPVTGVIARSATNVRAGAKTRLSSIIHSLIILVTIFAAAPLISQIPIAALAGVLFYVAFSMINYKEFYNLWKTVRAEAVIYAVTFFSIIFVDLLAGVQAGIAVACLIVLLRATKTHLHVSASSEDNILRLSLVGALTFLSTAKIADIQNQLSDKHEGQTVLIDLSNIRNLDMSGASAITDLFYFCRSKNINLFIKGLPRRFESVFRLCGGAALLDDWYLTSEHELRNKIGQHAPKSSYGRLVHGFQRFYIQRLHDDKRLFEIINKKQDPHTLFIACSDSRLVPSLITSTDPGELFIVRNVGNFIPPYLLNANHAEAAAIEFALSSFEITDIVICGHANCGAMKACQGNHAETISGSLSTWIKGIKSQLDLNKALDLNDLARMNVMNQVANLKLYPLVAQKIAANSLKIHAWFYNLEENLVYEWNHHEMDFKSIYVETMPNFIEA